MGKQKEKGKGNGKGGEFGNQFNNNFSQWDGQYNQNSGWNGTGGGDSWNNHQNFGTQSQGNWNYTQNSSWDPNHGQGTPQGKGNDANSQRNSKGKGKGKGKSGSQQGNKGNDRFIPMGVFNQFKDESKKFNPNGPIPCKMFNFFGRCETPGCVFPHANPDGSSVPYFRQQLSGVN